MKRFVCAPFFAVTVLLMAGCASRPIASQPISGAIDLQANFEKSHVILYLDDKLLYDGTVTSYAALSSTGERIPFISYKPIVTLKVKINEIQGEHELDLRNGHYIGVSYHWIKKQPRVIQSINEFWYD